MKFHERLLSLRLESGLNQQACAESLGGIHKSKYNKWENGANRPDYETVCMIAKHYGVSTDYLLGITDAKKPENELLISELGLSDKAIEVIKNFRSSDFPQYPLYQLLPDKAPVLIDQSCDKRTLADVLDAMLRADMMEPFLNILRTLTSPIPERIAFSQWEGEGHASKFVVEGSFDANYKGLLQDALNSIVDVVLDDSAKRIESGNTKNLFEDASQPHDGE